MKNLSQIHLWLIVLIYSAACVGTTLPVTSHTILPHQAVATPQATPTSDPSIYGGIKIKGNSEFVTQTRAALDFTGTKSSRCIQKNPNLCWHYRAGGTQRHVGMGSPPRYEVGDATAFFSVTWYASTIAHDATHSELYAQYQAAHPGEPVPEEAYSGVEIERFCIGYQLEVSKRIGAPQSEIDYLSTLDGTHCDVDHDGDCDWDDYQNRNW